MDNYVGLLTFCTLLGAILAGDEQNIVLSFFVGLSNVMMLLAHLILIYAPIGVFFLTASFIVESEDLQVRLRHSKATATKTTAPTDIGAIAAFDCAYVANTVPITLWLLLCTLLRV